MRKPTDEQIQRLNRVIVHCSIPNGDDVYSSKNVRLGDLVMNIIKVLNEKKKNTD